MSEIPKYIQNEYTLIWYRPNGEYRQPQEGDVYYVDNCIKPFINRCHTNNYPEKRIILTQCSPQPDRGMIWGQHGKTKTWVVLSDEIRVPNQGEFYPQLINGNWYVYQCQGNVTGHKRILIPQNDYAHLVFQKSQWQGPGKELLPPQTTEEHDTEKCILDTKLTDAILAKGHALHDAFDSLILTGSATCRIRNNDSIEITHIPSSEIFKHKGNQQENSTMPNIINTVTQETYINGTEASQLNDNKLIELIANSEKEVVALAEMTTQSKAIKARQKDLADNIDAVSKILDERYEAKKAKK